MTKLDSRGDKGSATDIGQKIKTNHCPTSPFSGSPGAPAPGGFGEGFGGEAPAAPVEGDTVQIPDEDVSDSGEGEPLALFPGATPEGAQGVQDGSAGAQEVPTLQDVADAVAESVPAGTSQEEVGQILDGLQTRRVRKLPTLQDVADSVAEGLPPGASEDDISAIVDEVTK